MSAVRQQILDAARAVFEREGVADAVMSDIAVEAGLSVGSIYVHFRSKEDVLTKLIEQGDTNAGVFEACGTASELLALIETIVKRQDDPSAANLTALEVATIARRNPRIQSIVAANFARLRTALFDAVARVGAANEQLDKAAVRAIGEGLLSLLVAAQAKALLGVPTQTEAKISAARWLMTILHGSPVRAKR